MRTAIDGIDHLVILVRDIDRAQHSYRQLGFTLTPRGTHTLGSQNHCLMFGRDYLELLAVPKPHPVMAFFHEFLARGEGLAGMALATSDADALHRSLVADGIAAQPPVEFSRPVDVDNETRDARFRVLQVPTSATPGGQVFACQHFTRELVWRPEYQSHPVRVTSIAAVTVCSADPEATAVAYARVLGAGVARHDGVATVCCGDAKLHFLDEVRAQRSLAGVALPANGRPVLAAIRLRVDDVDETARVLLSGGARPARSSDGSIAIGADQAHGVVLVFACGDA